MAKDPFKAVLESTRHGMVSHYGLDFLQMGEHSYYIWRHLSEDLGRRATLLIDLNGIYLPEREMEKLIYGFDGAGGAILSIAFLGGHQCNQRELKLKLKARDVSLFSRTVFFQDQAQARRWLASQQNTSVEA